MAEPREREAVDYRFLVGAAWFFFSGLLRLLIGEDHALGVKITLAASPLWIFGFQSACKLKRATDLQRHGGEK